MGITKPLYVEAITRCLQQSSIKQMDFPSVEQSELDGKKAPIGSL